VAVDDRRRRRDLYEVSLRPHDERVEVAGWTYYVRAVKRADISRSSAADSEFTGTGQLTTELSLTCRCCCGSSVGYETGEDHGSWALTASARCRPGTTSRRESSIGRLLER